MRRVLVGVVFSGVVGTCGIGIWDGPGTRWASDECFELEPRIKSDNSVVLERNLPGVGIVAEEGGMAGKVNESGLPKRGMESVRDRRRAVDALARGRRE